MSPQNHQKGNLMFTLPKSDILHFNQSQVQNRHKVHRTKEQMTFPHVLRRLNTWGTQLEREGESERVGVEREGKRERLIERVGGGGEKGG
jgi:hypothetical protein